jgi:thioesterase domain-containing protein
VEGERRVPLYFVPSWAADVEFGRRLVGALAPSVALHLLPRVDGKAGWPEDVDGWVAIYLDELAAVESGAVRLVGYSLGGLIALEVGRALTRVGRPPEHVTMIDTNRPTPRPRGARAVVRFHAATMAGMSVRYWPRYAGRVTRRAIRTPARRAAVVQHEDPAARSIHLTFLRYRPARYDGSATLITTRGSVARCWGDETLGWGRFFDRLDVRSVGDADHFKLFEPPALTAVAALVADAAHGSTTTTR